ncbi:MAG: hypothetical protein ACXU8N_09935 [Telluria sp.]
MFSFFHPRKVTSDKPTADYVVPAAERVRPARTDVLVAESAPPPPTPPAEKPRPD